MAENWTKLAEAIGMVRVRYTDHYWEDLGNGDVKHVDALPAYLMEPAQTARILARYPLHLSPVEGNLYVVAAYNVNGETVRECGPVCEAVARCAAKLEAEANL